MIAMCTLYLRVVSGIIILNNNIMLNRHRVIQIRMSVDMGFEIAP